jgi:hypothetical protein
LLKEAKVIVTTLAVRERQGAAMHVETAIAALHHMAGALLYTSILITKHTDADCTACYEDICNVI